MRIALLFVTGVLALSGCSILNNTDGPLSSASSRVSTTSLENAQWPLRGELFTHDPAIGIEGDTWFSFYTADGIGLNVSEDAGLTWAKTYRPALPWSMVQTMRDNWWKQYVPNYSGTSIWAPDVFQYQGRQYLYYAVSSFGRNSSAIGLVSTESIENADWVDEGLVLASSATDNFNAIDANAFEDPQSGRLWLAFGSYWSGLKLVEINPDTMKPMADSPYVSLASRPGVKHNPIEAPALAYADGYYYLFASIDRCCADSNSTYKVIVGRSKSVTGPYLDDLGISMLDGGGLVVWDNAKAGRVQGFGGGQDVFQRNDGSWAMAWHIYNREQSGHPELAISKISFINGWPLLGSPE